jgi:hypothetical protein
MAQRRFGDGLIAEEAADGEDWMTHADQLLDDEQIVTSVYEGLAQHPHSRRRGKSRSECRLLRFGENRE